MHLRIQIILVEPNRFDNKEGKHDSPVETHISKIAQIELIKSSPCLGAEQPVTAGTSLDPAAFWPLCSKNMVARH
eukprot:1146519-Pelagomonas_calceolata.AAC.3